MLRPGMYIHVELAAMAPKESRKKKGKSIDRAKMPTSVKNWRFALDSDHTNKFISEYICGLIRIYNVCGINGERSRDLFADIRFLNPVTTRHVSSFHLIQLHSWCRCSPCRDWWEAFRSDMGKLFDKTCKQMNNWRWDNSCAFRVWGEHSNLQTTSLGKAKHTRERFFWYSSNDPTAKVYPPSCLQYKPGNF